MTAWMATPLVQAIQDRDLFRLKQLVKQGADPYQKDNHGRDAIIRAAYVGWADAWQLFKNSGIRLSDSISLVDLVSLLPRHPGLSSSAEFHKMAVMLLAEQPDLELKDEKGRTALWSACHQGVKTAALMLIKTGAEVNSCNNQGCTVLSAALNYGFRAHTDNLTVIQALLDAGASPFAGSQQMQPPFALYWATYGEGRSSSLIQMLLNAGAEANDIEPESGRSALINSLHRPDIVKCLLDAGANTEHRTRQGMTALAEAAKRGRADSLALLLQYGADPMALDSLGRSPLDWADKGGHTECRKLLQQAIPEGGKAVSGPLPLHRALDLGYETEAARLLANRDYLKQTDPEGNTPLHLAARQGVLTIAQVLITEQMPLDALNHNGQTPLWLASKGHHTALAHDLMRSGANPNIADKYGRTPLHLCAEHPDTELAALLLKYGSNPNLCYRLAGEHTALSQAIRYTNLALIRLLLQQGADARQHETGELSSGGLLNQAASQANLPVEAIDLLINAGADLHARDFKGNTPLHLAVNYGSREIMAALLAKGADTEAVNRDGSTPLMAAAVTGDYKKTELLLDNSANPNHQNRRGTTALHLAAFNLNRDSVRQLLLAGARPTLTDNDGRTPRDWADEPFSPNAEAQDLIIQLLTQTGISKRKGSD